MTDKSKRLLSTAGNFFKNLFTKNIALKIIALLFAFLLWAYVLTIENPEYAKVIRDVEITMTGEETLSDKGLMLVSRELGTTDVTVVCEIGKHSELDASRVSCNVDLSSRTINLAEDEDSKVFPLTVTTSLLTGYGSITAVENSTVNVEVARISTRRDLPVSIEYEGAMPAGFQFLVPEHLSITVSGMKSLVDQIAKGQITIDLSAFPVSDPETLAGEYSNVYPVRFYNSSNIGIENIYNDNGESYSIEVPITIRAYREVDIEADVDVPDGYDYTLTLSRSKVFIYGDRADLLAQNNLKTEPIAVTPDMSGTEIEADLVLPDGISLGREDSGKVSVTVQLEETADTVEYMLPITYTGIASNLERGEEFPTEASVLVTGTLRQLVGFSTAHVKLTADLSGFGAGEHSIPILMTVDKRAGDLVIRLADQNVKITLVEKPPAGEQNEQTGG